MKTANTYSLIVFYIPGLIGVLPIILLMGIIPYEKWEKLFWIFAYINYLSIGVGMLLLVPFIKFQRSIAKSIENKVFDYGKRFPTTELLLCLNQTLSGSYKSKIREKLQELSGILLLNAVAEQRDPEEARKTIKDSMVNVRNHTRSSKYSSDANIAYGFAKNLAGAFILALLPAFIVCVMFYRQDNEPGVFLIGSYITIALLYLAFSNRYIKERADNYAQRLFEDFMTTKENQ